MSITKGNTSSYHPKANMDREKGRYPELSDFGGGGRLREETYRRVSMRSLRASSCGLVALHSAQEIVPYIRTLVRDKRPTQP